MFGCVYARYIRETANSSRSKDTVSENSNRFRIRAILKFFSQKFLSIQLWSLSDLVSENRVRFERSIKQYFHIPEKSIEK